MSPDQWLGLVLLIVGVVGVAYCVAGYLKLAACLVCLVLGRLRGERPDRGE